MNIPAPMILGQCETISLRAPLGWLGPAALELAGARTPVILHELGTPDERERIGPRELGEGTFAALESVGFAKAWGFGAVCREGEEAALFSAGGATWFTFDLAEKIELRAEAMSLDELDAAIVALEDEGSFPLEWHEPYLQPGREFPGAPGFAFSDEELARCAVKFGRALSHGARLLNQAVVGSGGILPDVEFGFDAGPLVTKGEMLFVCAELARRGMFGSAGARVRPSFGKWDELGGGEDEELSAAEELRGLVGLGGPAITLAAPMRLARALGWQKAHWDATEESRLAFLAELARNQPEFFRKWLAAAHEIFPVARGGKRITTTEDDVRALPKVADAALATTFLEAKQGRQLLLATWEEVRGALWKEGRGVSRADG